MIVKEIIATNKDSQSFLKQYLSLMYPKEDGHNLVLVDDYIVTSSMYFRDCLRVAKYASDPNTRIIILRNKDDDSLMSESVNYSALMALPNVASHRSADLGSLMDTYKQMLKSEKKDDQTARTIFNFRRREQGMLYLKNLLEKPAKNNQENWLRECAELDIGIEGTDKEKIAYVKKWRAELNNDFRNKYLPGLFVNIFETMCNVIWDVDMTLLTALRKVVENECVNVFVIYDREDSWVQKKLQNAKVPWLAIPKCVLKTATLEMVIDNESKEQFELKYGINAKQYIQISVIPKMEKPDLNKYISDQYISKFKPLLP